jgi:Flp pilus assembly protein CpaB
MYTNMNSSIIMVFAVVAALGLVSVVAVDMSQQQAEAAQPPGRGCEFTPGGNASKTRCVH